MSLTSWRVALRIARRDALRAKGRSALVIAMIALPVLGVTGADVVFRSAQLEPEQKIVRLMGEADAVVSAYGRGMTVVQPPNPNEGAAADMPREGEKPTAEQQRSLDTEPAGLLAALLPAGSRLTPLGSGESVAASTKEGMLRTSVLEADLTDPVWTGHTVLTGGRAPVAANELAASREFLKLSGLRIGDTTTLKGLEGRPFTITAEVEYPGELTFTQLVLRPGSAPPIARPDTGPFGGGKWMVRMPAGTELAWPKVLELNKYGFAVTSKAVLLDPPPRSEVPFYQRQGTGAPMIDATALAVLATVVGMALLEIVLLAGPAFAVGARRSRRQLGLLAAGGGDRKHVRAVVLGGGVVLGLAGAVVGLVLAVLLVAATRPWLEDLAGRRFGSFDLMPLDLLGIVVVGLVTGLLAAVVPAVQASRQDVVEALTGRGSVKPPNRRLAVLGLLMVAGGAALALLGAQLVDRTLAVLGGSIIAELGMVACTPMLVGQFGKLGRWLPLSPRLALRDSVRHRGRTAPAVAAVMAAVAGSVAVGIYTASSDAEHRRDYSAVLPSGAVLLSTGYGESRDKAVYALQQGVLEQTLPELGPRGEVFQAGYKGELYQQGSGRLELALPKDLRCPADDPSARQLGEQETDALRRDARCKDPVGLYVNAIGGQLLVGDATALANLTGVRDPAAAAALAAGKVIVFDAAYLKDGKAALVLTEPEPEAARTPSGLAQAADGTLAAVRSESHEIAVDAALFAPAVKNAGSFASPETAKRLGLVTSLAGTVWQPPTVPSSGQEQKAVAALAKTGDSNFTVERGYRGEVGLEVLALTGFAGLVALGAAGIATGLAAADSQRDLATLAAVGATGGIRRRLSGFQCGAIAAMGAVLGAICGVVPAVALRKIEAMPVYPGESAREAVIVFPWAELGLTVVVLPVVAVGLAMLFTRSRLGMLRRSA
ncbi:FtsX-like permease family protein [Kitasatospora sp. NPDC096147]|uniref:FtsX-like permease family protein n=1 Tax=Kitasatospora sp. NPDC096147 TaxID=3364093 RepID=UPI0037F2798C